MQRIVTKNYTTADSRNNKRAVPIGGPKGPIHRLNRREMIGLRS